MKQETDFRDAAMQDETSCAARSPPQYAPAPP